MSFITNNIWYYLGIGAFILIAGSYLYLFTGIGRRMRDWMSPASDKFINVKFLCEDKHIRDRKLKIEKYCITDEKKKRGFHLVHDLLLNKGGAGQFLVLNERDAFPIDFLGELKDEDKKKYPNAQRVFIDTTNDTDNESAQEGTKNFMGMSLSIIAMSGALVFIVMAIIVFWGGN